MTIGHGITAVFGCLVIFILSFVWRAFENDSELVAEDYYAREVAYQGRIDEEHNANTWRFPIHITSNAEGVNIEFEQLPETHQVTGTVNLFRPNDKRLDAEFPLELNPNNTMLIPAKNLASGRYEVQLQWNDKERTYYTSKYLFLP